MGISFQGFMQSNDKRIASFYPFMGACFTSGRHLASTKTPLVVLSHPHFQIPNRQQFHPKPIRHILGKPLDITAFLLSNLCSPKRSVGLTLYKYTLSPNTYYATFRPTKYRKFPCKYLLLLRKLGIILMDDLRHSGTQHHKKRTGNNFLS